MQNWHPNMFWNRTHTSNFPWKYRRQFEALDGIYSSRPQQGRLQCNNHMRCKYGTKTCILENILTSESVGHHMGVYDYWSLNTNQRMRSCTRVAKVRWPPRVGPIWFNCFSLEPFYIFLDFGSSKKQTTDLSHTNFLVRVYIAYSRPGLTL